MTDPLRTRHPRTFLPLLIGISIVAVIAIAVIFVWAVRSGQFDDLDTPAVRILTDEDESPPPG